MILFLKPYFDKKPWAGNDIHKIFRCGKDIGEAWLVSAMPGKSSIIKNGPYENMPLSEFWRYHANKYGFSADYQFPLLIKLISNKEKLSVQVHPSDRYASKFGQFGKFECWYVLKSGTGDMIVGTNALSINELKEAALKNDVEPLLEKCKVNKDDLVIIKPGTLHALSEDSFILEIQEPSDITYRLYDYNREPRRELHVNEALEVIDINREEKIFHFQKPKTFNCLHFSIKKKSIKNFAEMKNDIKGRVFYILNGKGKINNQEVHQYDSFIVDRNEKVLFVFGNLDLLIITPRTKRIKQ